MSSPFPGMDPYLESPQRWRGVHTLLIAELTTQLNRQLPAGLVAQAEERCYVVPRQEEIIPDAALLRSALASDAEIQSSLTPSGGSATAAVLATPPLVFELEGVEVREPYIEIVTTDTDERVVTVVEVLSPANKAAGSRGREEYVRKRNALLDSSSHLLEIDLLRGGAHTVAMERAGIAAKHPFDYVICLHRAGGGRRHFECWPLGIRDTLPQILVPLPPEQPDLVLDLQNLLNHVYENGAYQRRIDYSVEPEPPLAASDAVWADTLLREQGWRSSAGGKS